MTPNPQWYPYKGYYIRPSMGPGKAGNRGLPTTKSWHVVKMVEGGHQMLKTISYKIAVTGARQKAFDKAKAHIDKLPPHGQ